MITPALLQRYFNGQCTPAEERTVILWLQDDMADHSPLQSMMSEQWNGHEDPAAGGELKAILLHELRQQLYPAQPAMKPVQHRWLWYAAASVVLLLLAGLGLWNTGKNRHRATSMAAVMQWDTIVNNAAQKKHIVLPDRTQIWLSPGSRIVYAASPTSTERAVHLEGQAFFDVAQEVARPFLVYTGHVRTTVLGTAFNVEAYSTENEIRISLVNGRVAVHHTHGPAEVLQAGEMLTYLKTANTTRKENLKMNTLADWTGHQLVLNNVPVNAALERIAQQYQLTIHYGKDVRLDDKRFSTTFDQETPEQMIQNILFITDYHYHLQGKKLSISR